MTSPVENPPGQPQLRRRVDTQGSALARMRADLASPRHPLEVRSLAAHGSDEPAIALLDAWALVADVVAFYSERIATEGFLRTATQTGSVRELARTLGYELRPGVAAEADLVFTAETAPGAPATVTVAAGTPVQSVPGAGQLPQTFQTAADLEVRGVWNSLPVHGSTSQTVTTRTQSVWLEGTQLRIKAGDRLLIVGTLDGSPEVQQRHAVVVQAVVTAPDGLDGWTSVDLDEALFVPGRDLPLPDGPGPDGPGPAGPGPDFPGPDFPGPDFPGPDVSLPGVLAGLEVYAFAERARMFGWNAPDPALLVVDNKPPPGVKKDEEGDPVRPYEWQGYGVRSPVEVDGDHPAVLPGSWLLLVEGTATHVIARRPRGHRRRVEVDSQRPDHVGHTAGGNVGQRLRPGLLQPARGGRVLRQQLAARRADARSGLGGWAAGAGHRHRPAAAAGTSRAAERHRRHDRRPAHRAGHRGQLHGRRRR